MEGKTCLSAKVIQYLTDAGFYVAFVFISFRIRHTTLQILQSLIFQVVSSNPGLRPVLLDAIEANYFNLSSSVQDTLDVLKDLIEETTFIVIDSLDEMLEKERVSLSSHLVTLLKEVPKLRLLTSSRSEDDLVRMLAPHTVVVQTHNQNRHDIEIYVEQRSDEWLQTLDVEDNIITEIRQLLRPIAEKATGSLYPHNRKIET